MIDKKLVNKVSSLLKGKDLKIATAESCTGGLIGHILTNVSGSSDYFDRGVVSYSNLSKMELLDVSEELLENHGAVSKEVAKAMAEGIRRKADVDIGVSSTGIAGPTGGTKEKPVGLVYMGLSTKDKTIAEKHVFSGDRIENKYSTCSTVLKMLLAEIS
ncbi:MAG: CinA family protein [Candidatus Thermoplasmatota archaeon]